VADNALVTGSIVTGLVAVLTALATAGRPFLRFCKEFGAAWRSRRQEMDERAKALDDAQFGLIKGASDLVAGNFGLYQTVQAIVKTELLDALRVNEALRGQIRDSNGRIEGLERDVRDLKQNCSDSNRRLDESERAHAECERMNNVLKTEIEKLKHPEGTP
jgi:DNA repair exonuclease SbcCD ATPase subunit